jgi:hypothetical protein
LNGGGAATTGAAPVVLVAAADRVAAADEVAAGEDVPAATTPPCPAGELVRSTRLGPCSGSLPVRVALAMTPIASTPIAAMPSVRKTTTLRRIKAPTPASSAAPVCVAAARCRGRFGLPSRIASPHSWQKGYIPPTAELP